MNHYQFLELQTGERTPPSLLPVGSPRVGCLVRNRQGNFALLGFGVYAGDYTPEQWRLRVPKIVLDSGEVVWGSEVWWSLEADIRRQLALWRHSGVPVDSVTLEDVRGVAR